MKYGEKCLAKNRNFPFCYDVANVLRCFSPEREKVTLQTSCGAERVRGRLAYSGSQLLGVIGYAWYIGAILYPVTVGFLIEELV